VRGRYGGLCSLEKLKAQKLKLKKMDPRSWAGMTKRGVTGMTEKRCHSRESGNPESAFAKNLKMP